MTVNACAKSFHGKTILRCPGLTLEPGLIYAVVGANGSGKSTLARLVSGVLPADGHVRVVPGGEKIRYMPQKSYVFRLSTRSNILLAGKDAARAETLMRALRLDGLARRRAGVLSGGETAKMALCRVLMQPCHLLVLDEPTAAMDMESAAVSEQLILDYRRETGCSVLLITHDLHQARRIADRALFFHRGELLEAGAADRVLHHPDRTETRAFLDFYGG